MSLLKKATMLGAAGTAASGGLYVEEVFSTYLYTGNGSTQTITNGIDLAGEGGLVWIKPRNKLDDHQLYDTERGLFGNTAYDLNTNNTSAQTYNSVFGLNAFNSTGFGITGSADQINSTTGSYVSWTFRKAPKFFDVVTYTGDGSSNRQIAHNLGCEVGMLVVKRTDGSNPWAVYHRGSDASAPEDKELQLNETDAAVNGYTTWARTAPTTTDFTVGSEGKVNENGWTYVAYLFAHNDGDGGFGESGDQDIIKCGSYTGAYPSTVDLNLGFEPQWILIKNASQASNWGIFDVARGLPSNTSTATLATDSSAAENGVLGAADLGALKADGILIDSGLTATNVSGNTHIYIAIRRPMKTPTSGSEVFAVDTMGSTGDGNMPAFRAGFPPDFALFREVNTTYHTRAYDRLRNAAYLLTPSTDAESGSGTAYWSHMNGFYGVTATSSNHYSWMFRRAPSFFDVVCFTSPDYAVHAYTHSLGVTPELYIVKRRDSTSDWAVYSETIGNTKYLRLQSSLPEATGGYWGNTSPTSTQFYWSGVTSATFVAYLFASVPGVSKVGSYTGNGTSQNIDCGFSTGARFVLIKRTDDSGDWYVWDTTRGIVAGNDRFLELNTTDAENSSYDSVDPYSAGFSVNQDAGTNINVSSGTYIFLAIS